MPSKKYVLDGDLPVTVYKRKTSRNLRLSITPAGAVRVSIPAWAPYRAGLDFAKSRQVWIRRQNVRVKPLVHGQPVGKAHHLEFLAKPAIEKATTRIYETTIVVSHPVSDDPAGQAVQLAAHEACIRALRSQAERLLSQRLAALAEKHDFVYAGVGIRRLKSRWGSCDREGQIILNLFLMQLPWDLIDYVLMHELTHTRILKHGPDFWEAMEAVLPKTRALKKALRSYQPVLNSVG